VFNEGESITLKATTNNIPSAVDKMLYYANGVFIGQSTVASTYDYLWEGMSAGDFTLTAKAVYNATSDTVESLAGIAIQVQGSPVFSAISITPNNVILDSASTIQYAAEAFDQYGNPLASQPTFTWTSTGGSIDASGLFTANDNVGIYYIKATATVSATTITDSTSVTIKLPGSGCTEDFNDNSLSAMWTTIIQCEDAQGTINENGGELVIDAATSACNNFYSSPRKFFNGIFSAPVSGNFEVSVKVVSGTSADAGSRAGILISRDISEYGTTDAAGMAAVLARPGGNDYRLYSDPDKDGWLSTLDNPSVSLSYPTWLKIERMGDNVTGYISSNGTDWTTIATRNIGYGTAAMEIGLVSAQASVVFDDLVMSACPAMPVTPADAVISSNDTTVTLGTTIFFDASESLPSSEASSIVSYEWDFRDNNTTTGVTTSHTYNSAGSYNVLLTITDDMGNINTDSLTITVDALTFTKGIKDNLVHIYPNPARDYIHVSSASPFTYKITSIGGVAIKEGVSEKSIEINALQTGVYLLNINGIYFKFIKQ
jgi:PKD repeat protein